MAARSVLTDHCISALKAKKVREHLTWGDVASELNISKDTIYRLLARSRGPGVEVAMRLSEYLCVPVPQVFVRQNN